jgi:S1-C subfamily serine protease
VKQIMNTWLNKILLPTIIIGTTCAITIVQTEVVSAQNVAKTAEEITVLIQGSGSAGSGVIIAREGSTYYVLTAAHVIKDTQPGEEADLITADQRLNSIDTNKITKFSGYDLAIVQFNSNRNYKVAEIANSDQVTRLMPVFVAGFPLKGQATEGGFFITDGRISNINSQNADGYHLVYTSPTRRGMSGGPVLNQHGQVIGIHGRAEGNAEQGKEQGFNLGIPVNIFQQEARKAGLNINLQIATNTPTPIELPPTPQTGGGGILGRPPGVTSTGGNVPAGNQK